MKTPYLDLSIAPVTEPISWEEAALAVTSKAGHILNKEYLNICIRSARVFAEEFLNRSLITQCWVLQYDNYVPQIIHLPKGPVQAIKQVLIVNDGWENIPLDRKAYSLSAKGDKLTFHAIPMGMLITVEFLTGYGEAKDVPSDIRCGILEHAVTMYRHGATDTLPQTVTDYYNPYKTLKI